MELSAGTGARSFDELAARVEQLESLGVSRVVLPPLPGAQLDGLAAAWRSESAWEGETQAGGVTLPGSLAGVVALNEVLLHGWDLARATGQDYRGDPDSLEASIGMLSQAESMEMRGTIFGPVVEVPGHAPLLDRAVALSGRSPDWSPASR